MQDILTYTAWLDVACDICNSLLKATVTIVDNEFKVVASKYRWVTFISTERIHWVYDKGWEPVFGATKLMETIIDRWKQLIVEENN